MIEYNGKSDVSDKMLSGECKGIYMKDVVSDVSGKTLAAKCKSVILGDKCVYGADYPALGDLLIQYPALGDLLIQYPALGEFIAEDPAVVHSLIETGYTRWLVGDHIASINTEILIYPSTKIDMTFMITNYDTRNHEVLIAGKVWNDKLATYGVSLNCSSKRLFNLGATTGEFYSILLNTVYNIKLDASKNYCIINNATVNGKSAFGGEVTNSGLFHQIWGKTQFIYVDGRLYLVPFIRNNECGMIDLLTGTFYGNASTSGQFTIELTKKE